MKIYSVLALFFMWNLTAHAGGAIVAGGKTNSAIVIYNDQLDPASQQLILNELGRQLAMGMISEYGWVTDPEGRPAKCAQFGLLRTYNESVRILTSIAAQAGRPDAVIPAGSCRFDTVQ